MVVLLLAQRGEYFNKSRCHAQGTFFVSFCVSATRILVSWSVKPRNKGLHSHNELQYLSGGNALYGRIKIYNKTP